MPSAPGNQRSDSGSVNGSGKVVSARARAAEPLGEGAAERVGVGARAEDDGRPGVGGLGEDGRSSRDGEVGRERDETVTGSGARTRLRSRRRVLLLGDAATPAG